MIDTILGILNSVALAVLLIACACHINTMDRTTAGCERVGFVLTGAGALGHALAYWWPSVESLEFETMLHVGLACISIAVIRGDLRALVARVEAAWGGRDRRRTSSLTTEGRQ